MVCSLVACSLLGTGGMMTARAAESVTEGHRRCIFKMAHGRWQEISICPRIWKRQSLRWRETVNPKDLALCRFCVLVFSRCYPVIHLECFVKVAVIAVAKHGSKLFYGESCVF